MEKTSATTRRARGKARARNGASKAQDAARALALATDLRTFSTEFFALFGAQVKALDKRRNGAILATLPADLAAHFGTAELALAFQSVEPASGQQLVAHGSRTFERMIAWLDQRAALTVRRLPIVHAGSERLLSAVKPRNAGIANLRLNDAREPAYAFYWRLTYRADDKREELFTVVLDAGGEPIAMGREDRIGEDANALQWLTDALAASEPVITEAVITEPVITEPVQADAGAEMAASEVTPAAATGIKLPPLTQLVRMAEQARKYAVYHADVRCVQHEAEILARLYKVANRLTTYYEQQIEELAAHDVGDLRRSALEADLARKIAEEVENHRLRVHLELAGYALLYIPIASAEMKITDGKRSAPLRISLDRYSGVLHRAHCHACGDETSDVILCRNGHIACDACLRQCAGCGDVLCAECGVAVCPACGKQNCASCGSVCMACGERACAEHASRCPTCHDTVCASCQECCAACGVQQCRSHLRADAVLNDTGDAQLVCSQCAVRCAGCRQYSVRNGACALSGQRFCANCLVTCSECLRMVGPGFYGTLPNGATVCRECVLLCTGCNQPAQALLQCATCGDTCCAACSGACVACGAICCAQHHEVASGCGHVLCSAHVQHCTIGNEAICPQCNTTCAICGTRHCTHHSQFCALCGKLYCTRCIEPLSRICATCGEAVLEERFVNMLEEPCAVLPSVQLLAQAYAWRKAANRELTVYYGSAPRQAAIIVVGEKPSGELYATSRRLGARDFGALAEYRYARRQASKEQ